MKARILFFLHSLSGGGAERTVINIINNLDKNKYDILLVLGTNKNYDYEDFLDKNIEVKFLKVERLRYSLIKLVRLIIKEKPDLLFSTINANNIMLILAKILSLRRIPLIVREASHRSQSGNVTIFNKITTSILYNTFANKVIALSKGVREDLINNFFIMPNKINVIYNPVEIEKIIKMSQEKVYDFKKNSNEKLIIAVGRLVNAKDYETLLKAFKLVLEQINCRLIILGKGPLEKELKKLSKKLKINKNIIFMGFKSNPYKYMREADVFILSSKWEGFSHVIVEAMVTNTPVISTNCKSGPSEIIGENEYGILVPVGDSKKLAEAVIKLLNDNNLMLRYAVKGERRSLDFNAPKIVKKYESIFDELLH